MIPLLLHILLLPNEELHRIYGDGTVITVDRVNYPWQQVFLILSVRMSDARFGRIHYLWEGWFSGGSFYHKTVSVDFRQ